MRKRKSKLPTVKQHNKALQVYQLSILGYETGEAVGDVLRQRAKKEGIIYKAW